ncbi:MAG: GNAT family N-acetyltransferase [Stellaceae bacterium]
MADYPAELEEQVRLGEGVTVFLRPIRRGDGPLLQDLFDHMSPEDRRLRFFAPIRHLSEELVRQLTETDYETRIALLAFASDSGAVLGVARLATEPPTPRDRRSRGDPDDKSRAEFAVALRSDWHGHGLGWLLMQRMLALAARLKFGEVFGIVLRENETMLAMCREMGFTVEAAPDEAEAVIVRRRVATQGGSHAAQGKP